MKNIQAQYQDLLEGKISKANFMRNVRMQFPQHVTSVSSFDDSIKILKGKRILSEIKTDRKNTLNEIKIDGKEVKNFKQNGDKSYSVEFEDGTKATIYVSHDDWDILNNASKEKLNEAKQPEGVYGHNPNAEAPANPGIDQLNYYQVYHGIQYELAQAPEITDEAYVKARKKVVDTILKDPDAYKDLQLANFKAVKKMDKDLEMKEVKKDNLVDKPNEMKVAKKDAPASANGSKKQPKKKSKVQQMTQVPKKHKGIEVMDVPGKATVLALKEHILDELTKPNPEHEHINKGSRVKKKDAKEYDASKVGNVTDFDGHMATVKWDNETEEHVMPNILTKKDIPQHPEAAERFSKIPDSPFVTRPKNEEIEEIAKPEEDRPSMLKRLKERLIKAVKKEGYTIRTKTGKTLSAGRNKAQGMIAARDLERSTGDPLTVLDTKSGEEKDA